LNQSSLGSGGWDDWREALQDAVDAGNLQDGPATSLFLTETTAIITHTVTSNGPNFDLLSIFDSVPPVVPGSTPTSVFGNLFAGTREGFFFQ
jgi:hypothetical protein